MYDIGRQVFCKDLGFVGEISERNYIGKPRRACYIVSFAERARKRGAPADWMCGSKSLVAADFCCDECDQWRAGYPAAQARNPIDGCVEAAFCWLWKKGWERDYGRTGLRGP